ncbi:SusC/RagA family TonB-linked outer membrane protein [Plebeiibacterium sediminum]|uniref:TonB-dependent receptor n=1 Tax=Plebeiibacterium sediminum TaxID=2992112 RepID=A0AAE3SH46_9BACT|nr:TonB-dependent receptor [Plebeiobacterium sediminum]MCW3787938.1 TonB-dependent receptor [Plebeiobacterium sediminum]
MKNNNMSKVIKLLYCTLFLLFFIPITVLSQNVIIKGNVTDENNMPIVGASIVVKNTTLGTITDVEGNYSLKVPELNVILQYSFIGFKTQDVKVTSLITNVVMQSDIMGIEDVVVVGYGTAKKVTLTGSVVAVKGDELRQTKSENPQNMLTGRVAGVRVWQKSAEPGSYNNSLDIRGLGTPLIVIDGIPRTMEEFQRLNSSDIKDVSVLKDASAAIYGVRAANGVVLVTTKNGTKGEGVKITYNSSYTFQKPSGLPTLADALDAMTLYNEQSMNDINGGSIIYTEEDFEAYTNGTKKSTNWNSLIFSDYSPQHQHDVSISGGNDKTQYYMGMGYLFQEGFFKSGDLNYKKYNIRSNISSELTKGLTLDLKLSGIADVQNNPYSTSSDIIRNYWRQGVLYAAYADDENTMLNYEGLDLEENTVAKMTSDISGYRQYKQKYFQSSISLNYDFGTIHKALEGLSAKALFSYDYRLNNNKIYRKEYYQYAYNSLTDTYDSKLYNVSSPNQLRREFYNKEQKLSQILLNYNRTFKDKHNVSAMFGYEMSKRVGDNFYAQRNLAFAMEYLFAGEDEGQKGGMSSGSNDIYELANSAAIGRLNYTFLDRYITEFQFRYDGSSKFADGYQWGFFPSVSLGWRISEEPIFKSISALSFIDQLKVRASYGELGDDGSLEYDWATGYTYPATSGNAEKGYYNQYAPGYLFGNEFVYGVSTLALPNEQISWFTSRTVNIGVDFEAWNGLFGFSFDYFDRHREGLFARNTEALSTIVGATAPRENLNSDRHYGMELELTHRNRIGDFSYKINAIGTITRQMYLTAAQNNSYGNSYDEWRNDNLNDRYQGIVWGYESAGRYTSWEDIWTYDIYKENSTLPGDYKYLDWNGDGEINSQDEHPIAYDQTPWLNFSFGVDCNYKNFDLNLLLQGSALGSMRYEEPLYRIWGSNGGGTLTQYLDRWHPVDPTADPYDPSTEWVSGYYAYTGNYPYANSEFNTVSTAYLRLKSIELGYTIPKLKVIPNMDLRIYANAYNLFTITGVKFVDPEHPSDDLGRLYPLSKTYTMGLSLTF